MFVALISGTVGISRETQGFNYFKQLNPFLFFGIPRDMQGKGGYFFQFVDQMLTKIGYWGYSISQIHRLET